MKSKLILLGVCLFCLAGCTPKTKVIEEIQLVQALGYDYVNDEEFLGVAGTQITRPGEETLPENEIFTATGKTSRMIRKKIQTESSKTLVEGRIGLLLMNKELAEQGIYHFINTFERDSMIGRDIHLAIAEETSLEILSGDYNLDITVFEYLNELMEESNKEILPETNLHTVLYQYYGDGMDLFLPVMDKKKDRVFVIGLALFNDDVLVHQLNVREASIFKLLYERFRGGYYIIEVDPDTHVSVESVNASPTYKIYEDHTGIHVGIQVEVKGLVSEKEQIDTSKERNIQKIQKAGIREFEEKMTALITTFQELGIDPLGIGDRARSQIRHLNFKEWERLYPHIPIDVDVTLEIIGSGITE
ncbi:Ger(x)C family spore germination protein [Shouchella patagoniensis]|uniref:Ger(x)C family spore germination protein n=1 Tax=Shouchella patagoniensis TaxID=228576 RepID=UPI000995B802|nr:Ger(x)C family spore germination protein [Shouchella patagoniensis]